MASRLLIASSLASVALLVGLALVYTATGSALVFAQGADSLADALTGLGLLWAWTVSRRPPDQKHPYGHQGAQPIAALIVAMLVGALAIEVVAEAVKSLLGHAEPSLDGSIAMVLGGKVLLKLVFVAASSTAAMRQHAAMRAFRVDAASDVVVCITALVGFFAATYGDLPSLDAWLALPMGGWIGVSAILLARENIDLLLGAAPAQSWQDEITASVAKMPGVRAVASLRARSFGDDLHVWIEIHVDPVLTVGEAHDIGEAVEQRLLAREGVSDAVVHVDAASHSPPNS